VEAQARRQTSDPGCQRTENQNGLTGSFFAMKRADFTVENTHRQHVQQRAFEVPGYRGDYYGQPADDAPGIIRAP
jgi:hypothetical protein